MDGNVVEKCLAFCQALVTANKTFSLNLSINKDSFVFSNKGLSKSSCMAKKKSLSQVRREMRRRNERESKKSEVTVNVTEHCNPETPEVYSCNHCEVNFKTEKGLKIHIGKVHKEDELESTPEKECDKVQDDSSLLITPVKEVREEPEAEDTNTFQLVCKTCGDLWSPLKKPCYPSATYVDKIRWNTLCSNCWKYAMPCNVDYRFQNMK